MTITAKISYGTPTSIGTWTLASLAASATAGRESPAIDNTTTLAVDYIVGGKFTTGTSPTANNVFEVWCAGWDGSTWAASATGADAALTPTAKAPLLKLVGVVQVSGSNNIAYNWVCGSVAGLFGGNLPSKFSFWLLNNTGATSNATGTNFECFYTAVNYTSG